MNIPHGEVKHAPLKPHMSAGETRLYASLLDVATEYLEYGCGGSTILAAERRSFAALASIATQIGSPHFDSKN